MLKPSALFLASIFMTTLLIPGCGGEPYTYEPQNELKPGPGLFSGETGEFHLIGGPEKATEDKVQKEVEKKNEKQQKQ